MPGHLFVVQGDLTRLACDAWLLPTSRSLQIRKQWLRAAPPDLLRRVTQTGNPRVNRPDYHETWQFDGCIQTPPGWDSRSVRSFDLVEWQTEGGANRPWPTQIVTGGYGTPVEQAEWVTHGARQFVERAAETLRGHRPANNRNRHLLALPVVGTGHGGGWAVAGAILRELVIVLSDCVQRIDVDVALVTFSRDQLAAAQHARRQLSEQGALPDSWDSVTSRQRDVGRALAERSTRGRLVLFLGAGVSVGAGLPTWEELLKGLAVDAQFDENAAKALERLPAADQARLIRDRLERLSADDDQVDTLASAICKRVTSARYSLTHALLANLNFQEAVTTNYDTLFEDASRDAGYPAAVLPYESTEGKDRWLLKMHGCVNHEDDIVLTREDYLRYAERRGALAAIVQALLITHHMLFVGFSLTDDNFQRIADEVRKVVRATSSPNSTSGQAPFATALLLNPSPLLSYLWEGDIDCVSISGARDLASGGDGEDTSAAASQLEIMLDFVLFEANRNVGHLLDDRYRDLLSPEEQRLRDLVLDLERHATPAVRALPAWRLVSQLLDALGYRQPSL